MFVASILGCLLILLAAFLIACSPQESFEIFPRVEQLAQATTIPTVDQCQLEDLDSEMRELRSMIETQQKAVNLYIATQATRKVVRVEDPQPYCPSPREGHLGPLRPP